VRCSYDWNDCRKCEHNHTLGEKKKKKKKKKAVNPVWIKSGHDL